MKSTEYVIPKDVEFMKRIHEFIRHGMLEGKAIYTSDIIEYFDKEDYGLDFIIAQLGYLEQTGEAAAITQKRYLVFTD